MKRTTAACSTRDAGLHSVLRTTTVDCATHYSVSNSKDGKLDRDPRLPRAPHAPHIFIELIRPADDNIRKGLATSYAISLLHAHTELNGSIRDEK